MSEIVFEKNTKQIYLNMALKKQEEMLVKLYDYLSQEPTNEYYINVDGKKIINKNLKAYNYFEPREIVHDVWALHYTDFDNWEEIQTYGFRSGVNDLDTLGFTSQYYNEYITRDKGWNFALPIDNHYLADDCGYGLCGFLIKTDGVRAYHNIDKDEEIIFYSNMVKQIIPFFYSVDSDGWCISGYYEEENNLPSGAYYDEEVELIVFKDIKVLINVAISK